MFKVLNKYALQLAFLQAWIATLGSLYFSEVKGFFPCQFCWYQRILMYPLAVIFAVAIARKDKNVAYYALPFSIIGAFVAAYHYLIQWTALREVNPISCSVINDCSQKQVVYLGFITIPFFSLVAFLVITFLMLYLIKFPNNVRRK
ncbi:MAG: disulfide oxidoreductase [Patescibacteria group bacterium]|mgnify:CR=1 FL=1